jgi:hypothetical protein
MDPESTDSREVTKAFWRGFGGGLGSSLSSSANKRRFKSSFRLAYWLSAIGSMAALSRAKHLHAAGGRPLTTMDELAVVITGAVGATTIGLLCRWLWRRWNHAPAA